MRQWGTVAAKQPGSKSISPDRNRRRVVPSLVPRPLVWRWPPLVVLTAALVAVSAAPVPAGADAAGGPPGLTYTARSCTESAALVTMPRATLEARLDLPEPFTVRDFAPGVAALLVAVASCESISVGGKQARPGRFSDVGVMIEPPPASTGGDHLYQLWQVSDHEDLVSLMTKVGVATDRAGVWFEKTPASATGTVISELSNYKLSVFTSPPESGDGSGANTWWHDGTHGTVRIDNHGHRVASNFGNHVLELEAGSPLAQIVGTTVLSGVGAVVYFGEHRGELSLEQL